ncbi:uncharacterized protein LOC131219446 [Magnolia sinica]|uniref:uncharacterized protein LOC131219446 n=1 Tax=Magnolia sinica TaxID=86752 RepID=UPI0026588990|nr:uncharacterized protein LOC131219446 [Magnolia sinica]XP_058070563.1 uncharacterized protein LOC131219446 [Magnolia sinica]
MSRGQSQPRTQFGRRTLERYKDRGKSDNVVIIDVDQGKSSNVVMIDVPESSHQRTRGSRASGRNNKCPPKVIISIDDEEDGDGLQSDGTSSQKSRSGSNQSHLSEESDGDDCQIYDQDRNFPFKLSKCSRMCPGKGPFRHRFGLATDFESSSSDTESENSDCELMQGSSGEIREQWEKAALRKKKEDVHSGQFGCEVQASDSGSNANHKNQSHETTQTEAEQSEDASDHSSSSNVSSENENLSTCTATSVPEGKNHASDSDQTVDQVSCGRDDFLDKEKQVPGVHSSSNTQFESDTHDTHVNHDKASLQTKEESTSKPCPCTGKLRNVTQVHDGSVSQDKEETVHGVPSSCNTQSQHHAHVNHERVSFQGKEKAVSGEPSLCNSRPHEETRINGGTSCLQSEQEQVLQQLSLCSAQPCNVIPVTVRSLTTGDVDDTSGVQNNLISDREKHKETDEYRRATEEEWASRQRQLQIQAEEAQRLRKKRKAENLRLLDMERRQKLRLEEVRESQKKDEETINLKEQLRVEVRKELDKLELKYRDMASLLRGLGIPVGGGNHPMSRDVNAAYKQAVLRFHPDRASRYDIRQQVEAEETFKLISRLKEKLLPTA